MLQNWKILDPRVAEVKSSATYHPAYNYTYAITWWFALGVFPAPVMIIILQTEWCTDCGSNAYRSHQLATGWQNDVSKFFKENYIEGEPPFY